MVIYVKPAVCLSLVLLLFAVTAFGLPFERMTPQEQKEFERLPQQNSIGIIKITPNIANSAPTDFTSLLLRAANEQDLDKQINLNGSYSRLLTGQLYSVTINSAYTRSLLQSDVVTGFSVNAIHPLLDHSNPSINALTFYNNGFSGSGATMCIVDTGINETHEAFISKSFDNVDCAFSILPNQDLNFDGHDYNYGHDDFYGHGTHVAGITTSVNGQYEGIAYGAANIINAKGFDSSPTNPTGYCVNNSLEECFSQNRIHTADVANNSWGITNTNCDVNGEIADGNSLESSYIDSLVSFYHKTLVFAAGNNGPDLSWFSHCSDVNSLAVPADAFNVISVASMDTNRTNPRSDDSVSGFSSRGPTYDGRKKPDLTAPGGSADSDGLGAGIFSAWIGSNSAYQNESGTSMSAPHVTGAVALVTTAFHLNWLESKALLINSAQDINSPGWDKYSGWGYLDLNRAYYEGNNTLFLSIDKNNSINYAVSFLAGQKVSAVWDRYCDDSSNCSPITNIFLRMYDENGALVSDSNSLIDNVQQVSAPLTGNYRVRLSSQDTNFPDGFADENIALAFSGAPILSNAKIADLTESSPSPDANVLFFVDANIINNTSSKQDFNLMLFDGNAQSGDTNSFSLSAFHSSVKRLSTKIPTYGAHIITVSLSVPQYDSNALDNNYLFSIDAEAKQFGTLSSVGFPDIFPYPDANVQLSNRSFGIDVNVYNSASDGNSHDFNVLLFVNNSVVDFNSFRCAIGDYNTVSFSQTLVVPGDYNITVSLVPLVGESIVSDNNYSRVLHVDGNAVAITGVSFPLSALKDSNQRVDVNVLNYGPLVDSGIYLINKDTGAVLDSVPLRVGSDSSGFVSLFTQTLFSAGTMNLRISTPPLVNESYVSDNNSDFSVSVLAPSTNNPVSTGSCCGGGPTSSIPAPVVKKNETQESAISTVNYALGPAPKIGGEVLPLLSADEISIAQSELNKIFFSRSLSTLSIWDANGNKTNKTKVTIYVSSWPDGAKSLEVLEFIPKSIAIDANQIESVSPFKIIKKDPLVSFTLYPDSNITYFINGQFDSNTLDQFTSPLVISVLQIPKAPKVPAVDANKVLPLSEAPLASLPSSPPIDSNLLKQLVYAGLGLLFLSICFFGAALILKRASKTQ